jgi:hypothetical protein
MHLVDETDDQAIHWETALDHPAQSVDQRIKFPTWLGLVEARGGRIRYARVDSQALEALAHAHDLVIVATGRNGLGRLFERDTNRSPFAQPQRTTVLLSVRGMEAYPASAALSVNLIPGVGEYIALPGQWLHGACLYCLFACVPGGPLDAWDEVTTPVAHLNQARALLDTWLPWEAERLADAVLTDPRGMLRLRLTPIVRQPIGRLPDGQRVLGLGDTLTLNDPLTLQGANLATEGAAIYLNAIVQHGQRAFDEDWMRATFERVWAMAQPATQWTNSMLTPMLAHHRDLLRAAAHIPDLAHHLAHAFVTSKAISPWLLNAQQTATWLAQASVRPAALPSTKAHL